MNILLVIDSFGSGGAQRQLINLGLGLKKEGYNIEFYNYFPNHDHLRYLIEDAKIPIYDYYKKRRFSASVVFNLHQVIQRNSYDVVLSYLDTPSFYLELAALPSILRNKRPKIVVSERFMFLPGKLPAVKLIQQYFHYFADFITVNSNHQRINMFHRFSWMKGRIKTIYNGVDFSRFYPDRAYEFHEKFVFIAVGTIVRKKNAENLIKALIILKGLNQPLPIIRWIGKTDESIDGQNYYREMLLLIKKNGLEQNWIWEGEKSNIPLLYRECDFLIHPAFYEGLPNAICEGISSGLPVLASNVCDHPILVRNNENGFLFDPNDPKSIADSILHITQLPPSKLFEMRAVSEQIARELLTPENYIKEYSCLFRRLVKQKE